jgi:hypothetical protein
MVASKCPLSSWVASMKVKEGVTGGKAEDPDEFWTVEETAA